MKEVKFKAYLKESEEIFNVHVINFKSDLVILNKPYGNTEYLFNEIKLLQYTGLKDRKDLEIYEGHILQDRDGQKFCIKYNKYDAEYYLHMVKEGKVWNNVSNINQNIIWTYDMRVIGHVYTNPELLC